MTRNGSDQWPPKEGGAGRLHDRLKWYLSAASAALASAVVVALESAR